MDAADLASRYWDLANYLAGFAAVQMAAFLVAAFANDRMRRLVRRDWVLVVGLLIAVTIVYAGGIWACYWQEAELRQAARHSSIVLSKAFWAAWYRTGWVALFTALGILWVVRVRFRAIVGP